MAISKLKPGANALARAKPVVQVILALGSLMIVWHLASTRLTEFDGAALWAYLAGVSPLNIAIALACTAISYWAISLYDVVAYRCIGVEVDMSEAMKSGAAATACGQFLGFGVIVGAFVRWRLLRCGDIGAVDTARATGVITAGFFCGVFAIIAAAGVLMPTVVANLISVSPSDIQIASLAFAVSLGALLYCGARGHRPFGLPIPQPQVILAQIAVTCLDILPAIIALAVLMPEGVSLPLGMLFTAYTVALVLGLISNAPGGIGAFEAVLLLSFPHVEVEALLAAIIAFRVVYYVIPFLTAIGFGIWREIRPRPHAPRVLDAAGQSLIMATSSRADAALVHLGDKSCIVGADQRAFIMFGDRAGALIALGDPVGPESGWAEALTAFMDHARRLGKTPGFYKIGPDMAALCRAKGLHIDQIGEEAVIDLGLFDLSSRSHRQMRRKLSQAKRAGVEVTMFQPGEAPIHQLTAINAAWLGAKQGAESGFSMGIFARDYLRRFPVLVAYADGNPVGFLSLWQSGDQSEWSVDLMRSDDSAPQGTIQSLFIAAIEAAQSAGVSRFHLCMAPMSGLDQAPGTIAEQAGALLFAKSGHLAHLRGLRRFKDGFAPDWSPRFMARRRGPFGWLAFLATWRLVKAPALPHFAEEREDPMAEGELALTH